MIASTIAEIRKCEVFCQRSRLCHVARLRTVSYSSSLGCHRHHTTEMFCLLWQRRASCGGRTRAAARAAPTATAGTTAPCNVRTHLARPGNSLRTSPPASTRPVVTATRTCMRWPTARWRSSTRKLSTHGYVECVIYYGLLVSTWSALGAHSLREEE